MDWQLLFALGLVVAAVVYLFRQTWRAWAGKKAGCGGGCGCADKPRKTSDAPLIAPEQLLSRLKQSP